MSIKKQQLDLQWEIPGSKRMTELTVPGDVHCFLQFGVSLSKNKNLLVENFYTNICKGWNRQFHKCRFSIFWDRQVYSTVEFGFLFSWRFLTKNSGVSPFLAAPGLMTYILNQVSDVSQASLARDSFLPGMFNTEKQKL